jgi:hypothetical protein
MAWIDADTGRPYTEKELEAFKGQAGPAQHAAQPAPSDAPESFARPLASDVSDVNSFSGAVGKLGEQFGGGAMASLKKTYLGLKQLATYMTGDNQAREAVNNEIARMEEEYGPVLSTPAGKVGELAGTVGQFMIPGMAAAKVGKAIPATAAMAAKVAGAPGSIGRAAITAAAFEGAQPVTPGNTSIEDMLMHRGIRTALGAGLGAGVGAVANKLTRPGVKQLPILSGIEKEAERVGLKGKAALTPAQRTGDVDLLQFEEGLLSSPGSQNLIRNRRNAQQDVLNRAASKVMGYPKHDPTEAVFGMARDNANLAYEPIAQIPKIRTDVPYFDDLFRFAKKTDSDAAAKLAEKIQAKGSLSGSAFLEKLQDVRDLGFHASRQGDKYTAREFGKLSSIMEDFLERRLNDLAKKPGNTITTDTIKQFQDARLQQSVIHSLEKATDPVLGKVNPNKLLTGQFARQRPGSTPSHTTAALQDVTDISRVMRKTMPYIGSSGTAERLGGQRMVEADLNPLAQLRMAGPMLKNYMTARNYLAHGGQPGMLGGRLSPGQNAFVRRLLPPEAIGAGEAMVD